MSFPISEIRRLERRRFLGSAIGLMAASAGQLAFCSPPKNDRRPQVRNPRATDGDERYEPNWDQRLTLTVGPKSGDISGDSEKVIQAGLDYVSRLGGGTVRLLPGTFKLRNSVFLPSRTRLVGSGADSVITREASQTVDLGADSDWYDQEVMLAKDADFQVGDGIVLRAKNPGNGAAIVIKRTIVARSGRRLKLNDGLRQNLWLTGEPTCASLFPLLTSEYSADVRIENLCLDGNRNQVANLDGNHAGCVFLQDCSRFHFHNVEARNFNGDGISFQICHDVVVEECHSHDNAGLGLHPGSGSQRPLIRNCKLERNSIGLFWCWGVKFGLAENNQMVGNSNYGISIGHNDTDNVMRNNTVADSGKVGVLFRDDSRGKDFWANRNRLEKNRILNSGGESGIAVDIQGKTREVSLLGNEITESRAPMNRIAVRISENAQQISMDENRITGFSQAVADLRK